MKSVSGHDFAKAVQRRGWNLLRVHGSHHVYGKPGSDVRLPIPMHENRDLKAGLLSHLMKMADLSDGDL